MQQSPSSTTGGSSTTGSATGTDSGFSADIGTSSGTNMNAGSGAGMSSGSGSGTGTDLKQDAKQIGSKAADRVHSELDARKGTAATQAKSVASSIQRAAGELDDGAPAWLRSAFQQGADQIQRFADSIEQKDSRQLMEEVQSFARERPGMFLAACAAAGFAAARIFKAGAEGSSGSQSQQQFGSTYGSTPSFPSSQQPQSAVPASSPGEFV